MSWGNEMKEHLPGLASSGVSSVTKAADPSKRAKKRPLQHTDKEGVNEGDSTDTKRRLTVEQVNFLEASFTMDIKLEPERKVLLAKQLGVRPRQVAIWFQNRRARWKNKQVEQDYDMLKASYEAVEKEKEKLVKDYEEALEGNKRLQAEVARLTSLLQNTMEKEVNNKLLQAKEEQLSDKSELTSPTKSIDEESEVEDLAMSSDVTELATTSTTEKEVTNKLSQVKEEQLSEKSELMSPTKSVDEQSEVEDLAMSSDVTEFATTCTSVPEVVDSTVVCATRLDGENTPWLPSHVFLSSLPVLVQQLIVNGYCLEDALHIFFSCEDSFGSGLSLCEPS